MYQIFVWLFSNEYILHINNPIKIKSPGSLLDDLIVLKVVDAIEIKGEAKLIFEKGYELIVDMRDEVYYVPEAMCLYGPDNFCAVWN